MTDPFSRLGQGHPWIAYSWLFELLMYGLFQKFGLLGILGFIVVMTLSILIALMMLLRQSVTDNPMALVLYTGVAGFAFLPLYTPRPWLFTVLFFIVEFALLEAARQRAQPKLLWWLVPVFALWANLHVQFIYGLFLLGFLTVEPYLEALLRGAITRDNWRWLSATYFQPQRWLILLACVMATLATPYHFKIYRAVFEISSQTQVYQFVTELQPLNFSQPTAWTLLGLTLWTIARLGPRQFERRALVLLMLIGVVLSFRSNRDLWFLSVVAVTVLAKLTPPLPLAQQLSLPRWAWAVVILFSLTGLSLIGWQRDLTNSSLQAFIEKSYPVTAVKVIKERGYTGPLYNHFNWGGYLIWQLPQLPVSMDGRTNIYGGARIALSSAVWSGGRAWAKDPDLQAARLVVADVDMPLCELLRRDQRFELVHEDALAAVFIARTPNLVAPNLVTPNQVTNVARGQLFATAKDQPATR